MRRVDTLRFFIFLITALFIITGCTTTDSPRFESTTQMVQDEKYNIQVRIVTQEELEKQAGRTPSPFVIQPGLFDTREYVVIEFIINNKTDSPASFELTDLEMHFGAGVYYTKNTFQMKQYWEQEDNVNAAERRRMMDIAERYMLERDVTVPARGLKRGYAVFLANIPKYGEMTIYLPLFGGAYKPDIYEFSFPFTRI